MWINNYPELIKESEQDLLDREKLLRGSALESRIKMLRLLKTGAYRSQLRLAKALGYSPRQIRRWWKTYREGGLEALLEEDKARGGKKERITQEALHALEERMKAGEIARLEEARKFLEERFGIHYEGVSGLSRLFERHQIKLKTGRRRHREASAEEQAAFKK
jgi:transposase